MKIFKRTAIILFVVAVIIITILGFYLFIKRPTKSITPHILNLNTSDKFICSNAVHSQKTYLQKETLADTETFEKYKTNSTLSSAPADLNVNSNKFAKKFRTNIDFDLKNEGINFAGTYTVVDVGMTGSGSNYYIIDRKNGNAYLFPYFTDYLEFRKDSNLLIMNPKNEILNIINGAKDESDLCWYENQQRFSDLRPFYFLWKDNQFILLGPHNIDPPLNRFWDMNIESL